METPNVGPESKGPRRLGTSAGLVKKVIDWLDERLGFTALLPVMRKKEVPVHKHTFWYYIGGMALFLFIMQVCTGVLLLFYYRPSAEGAFDTKLSLNSEANQFGFYKNRANTAKVELPLSNWGGELFGGYIVERLSKMSFRL